MPEKTHILNLSFLTNRLQKNFGGTATNIGYNLSLLGIKPIILATAGKDFLPIKKILNKVGINTAYIRIYPNNFTSNYFAIVDRSDNQLGGFFSGAMERSATLSLSLLKQPIGFAIISPTLPETMVKLAKECRFRKIPYLFDPGMQLPRLSKENLIHSISGAEILIGNDYEISLMLKKLGWVKKELLSKIKIMITTLAEKGSTIETGKTFVRIKAAKPIKVIDPVGAGDAYRAGFMAGYIQGLDLKTCGQMGSLTAVYTVEKEGTTTHRFTIQTYCDRYKREFGHNLALKTN